MNCHRFHFTLLLLSFTWTGPSEPLIKDSLFWEWRVPLNIPGWTYSRTHTHLHTHKDASHLLLSEQITGTAGKGGYMSGMSCSDKYHNDPLTGVQLYSKAWGRLPKTYSSANISTLNSSMTSSAKTDVSKFAAHFCCDLLSRKESSWVHMPQHRLHVVNYILMSV